MSYTTNLEIQDEIIGKMGLGVDYYKGEPGEQGIPGKDGKTPVKGVDYFTDAEITEIKDEIAEKVQVGAKGEDGKSAYQLAVEAGYEGSETEWLASLKGKDGKDGKDGTNGVDGKTPVKGVDYFTTAEIQQIENEAAAKVDTSAYAKTADLSTVATSGSYNDLVDKPTIPSTTGLASTKYVDDKVAGIVIPTVPTNVSAFTNDAGYLIEHQSLADYALKSEIPSTTNLATKAEVQEVENKIPAPYTLPTASTSTLGGVKVDGNTITIADGVISSVGGSGGSEPEKYIKDASVSGNTLTLTKRDDTEVVFTPSGGGSSAVQGYAFTFGKTLTSEDKAHILEIQSNPLIPMYINGSLVSKIYSGGNYIQFRVIEIKGVGNDCFSVYSVNYNQSGITSNELNLQMQWYIASSNVTINGELITSYNLKDQIKQNAGWSYTTDSSESDLYNAKEMVLIGINAVNENFQQYYNFSYERNQNEACLGSDYQNITYTITASNSNNITWYYNGSSIDTSAVIQLILYKT